MKLLSVTEAAKILGLSERRVRMFCAEGRLGSRVGGAWVLTELEVRRFARLNRPAHRPPSK